MRIHQARRILVLIVLASFLAAEGQAFLQGHANAPWSARRTSFGLLDYHSPSSSLARRWATVVLTSGNSVDNETSVAASLSAEAVEDASASISSENDSTSVEKTLPAKEGGPRHHHYLDGRTSNRRAGGSGGRPRGGGQRWSNNKRNFKDVYGFNEALNRLAEQAGDARQPVVTRAMACEEMWKDPPNRDENTERPWQPDTVSFNTVLKAWNRATDVLAEHHSDRNHEHLLDPSIPIYTARECALHALNLLNQQEKLAAADSEEEAEGPKVPPPDSFSFNSVMDTWGKSQTPEGVTQVEALMRRLQKSTTMQPDIVSYNALVDAYAFSDRSDRLDKLRRIWSHMEAHPSLWPAARTTNSMLHAFSRMIREMPTSKRSRKGTASKAALELANEAMQVFDALKQRHSETGRTAFQPDVMTYTTAMDVWAKVGTVEATQQVEALFNELKSRRDDDENDNHHHSVRPNAYSYTTLITAWSRVAPGADQAADRVTEILDEMVRDPSLTSLSHRPFTAALRCWSRARVKGKAVKALNTLRQMRELAKTKEDPYVRPNAPTYHAALECCAKTLDSDFQQHTAALKIAFAILQTMKHDGIQVDHMTYGKLLRCVEALLPPGDERNKVALAAFEKARAAGMAESTVVTSFRKAADVQVVLKSAVGEISDRNGYVDLSRIPHSWKKNVRK